MELVEKTMLGFFGDLLFQLEQQMFVGSCTSSHSVLFLEVFCGFFMMV